MAPSPSLLTILFLGVAQLLPSGFAQSTAQSKSTSKTSSAAARTFTVTVGDGDHKFRPDVTQANVGDIIEFDFFPPNHSVVRAEYEHPCIPYEMTGKGKVGFFSGFHPVDAILSSPPKWTLRINDSNPIFFYCSAVGSCIDYGMVGVINPNATTSLTTQRDLALNSSYMLQPGDPFPPESSSPTSLSSPSPSTSTITSPTGQTSVPTHHATLSAGAIAGIAVAGAVVVFLGALLCFFVGRSRTLKKDLSRSQATIVRPDGEIGMGAGPMYAPGAIKYNGYTGVKRGASSAGGSVREVGTEWGEGPMGPYPVNVPPRMSNVGSPISPPLFSPRAMIPERPVEMEGSSPLEEHRRRV